MVAYTQDCHRLGYGGGFYDRTINALLSQDGAQVITIGLAFDI
jgi:5-formyltetrahydrofolate cyclo-ligase